MGWIKLVTHEQHKCELPNPNALYKNHYKILDGSMYKCDSVFCGKQWIVLNNRWEPYLG